jgi:hypothetical protein
MIRQIALLLAALVACAAPAQRPAVEVPPSHTKASPLFENLSPAAATALADGGVAIERDRSAPRRLAEHRRLTDALASMEPQRSGTVDAYVVAIALDSDPNFSREAREAGRVLARRYGAEGRTLVLAGPDARGGAALPMGSPQAMDIALARVAEVMDVREDVLILYTTSHGAQLGLVYNDGDQGFGAISPARLWTVLTQLGIGNRMLLLSACYSGVFVPMLQSDTSIIVTAASADRTSFGCQADADWTFFGDALINQAMRKAQPMPAAAAEAQRLIAGWERKGKLEPSNPQVAIGAGAQRWLAAIEARVPKTASAPVGRPAITLLDP